MNIICSSKEAISGNLAIRATNNKLEIVKINVNIPFTNTLGWNNIDEKNIVGTILTITFNRQESIDNLISELEKITL